MSLVVLGLGWIVLAGVVSPFFAAVLARFAPRLQAAVAFVACVSLAAIPAAVASILLARDLSGPGPVIRRCGALVSAVVADPLARPRVTLPLASLVAGVLGLGLGGRCAMGHLELRQPRTDKPISGAGIAERSIPRRLTARFGPTTMA